VAYAVRGRVNPIDLRSDRSALLRRHGHANIDGKEIRCRSMRSLRIALVLSVLLCAGASADGSQTIVQIGRAFQPGEVTIATGGTLIFRNQDEFIHQIYVKSDAMNFDSDEQPPGRDVLLKFTASGTFRVRCHIHPKMLLIVNVK
jgi:plastocyanin